MHSTMKTAVTQGEYENGYRNYIILTHSPDAFDDFGVSIFVCSTTISSLFVMVEFHCIVCIVGIRLVVAKRRERAIRVVAIFKR